MLFFVYNVQGGNIPLHNYHLLTPGDAEALLFLFVNPKMVNGFRYYRALESVSMIASALSTALTIYPILTAF